MGYGYFVLPAGFQLHHTGIKTGYFADLAGGKWQFQLHHTGIKTK